MYVRVYPTLDVSVRGYVVPPDLSRTPTLMQVSGLTSLLDAASSLPDTGDAGGTGDMGEKIPVKETKEIAIAMLRGCQPNSSPHAPLTAKRKGHRRSLSGDKACIRTRMLVPSTLHNCADPLTASDTTLTWLIESRECNLPTYRAYNPVTGTWL